MPATTLPVATITRAGVASATPVACDSTNGNSVPNSATVFLALTNGTGSQTVVVTIPGAIDGQPLPGRTLTLAANSTAYYGPFDPNIYGPTLSFKASANTVTVAAYQLVNQ